MKDGSILCLVVGEGKGDVRQGEGWEPCYHGDEYEAVLLLCKVTGQLAGVAV
ncbi:hypothetical protein E2C01_059585 [Portunus trituberculatus]|uniref:Uncharacterized protein n=1 Tax=Portunus trituberculatus TaxID=210409 RepID=A0A5B7GYL5_PORTR|nr:hypothetical protein [Portunus trituberculatus]